MPQSSFTTHYPGRVNVLTNDVIVAESTTPPRASLDRRTTACKDCRAIWDTGANRSAISEKVTRECNLSPIGVIEVQTGGGCTRTNQYLVDIGLPNGVLVTNIPVAQLDIMGAEVLIGMDIISNGDFAVTNLYGKTVFSFRTPSLECIDFVQNPYKPKLRMVMPKRKRGR